MPGPSSGGGTESTNAGDFDQGGSSWVNLPIDLDLGAPGQKAFDASNEGRSTAAIAAYADGKGDNDDDDDDDDDDEDLVE